MDNTAPIKLPEKDEASKHDKSTHLQDWGIFYRLAIIVIACVFLFPYLFDWILGNSVIIEQKGQIGDQYGALNALFTGVAFAGLITTIILQRKDLQLQRTDLQLQREELQLQREEMEKQSKEFQRQTTQAEEKNFTDAFYLRLELIDKLSSNITTICEKDNKRVYRKEAIDQIISDLEITSNFIISTKEKLIKDKEIAISALERLCNNKMSLSAWMASLLLLVKDTREAFKDNEEKRKHFLIILMSTLTIYERVILITFQAQFMDSEITDQVEQLEVGEFSKEWKMMIMNDPRTQSLNNNMESARIKKQHISHPGDLIQYPPEEGYSFLRNSK